MINKMIESISVALDAEFGDGYKIYAEEVRQGLKVPCFFIYCINPTYNLFLGKRYMRTNQFCIQYIPSSEEKQEECYAVAERLYQCLEWITTDGDLVRGSRMNSESMDGILNFFLNYDFFVRRMEQLEQMETIKEHINTKGQGG